MNIIDYVKEYGRYSFFDKEFNEVDSAILSALAYVDFNNIVSDKRDEVSLGYALEYFIKNYDLKKFKKSGVFQKDTLKLIDYVKVSDRFKDIKVYNYIYDVTFDKQFSAMTMKLPNRDKVIVFEGTDDKLVGWEEDAAMCYTFPVPAEKDAIKYVRKNVHLFDRNVYVIGHSKGGHLAMVGAMYANVFARFKIKKVYNLDGPGLRGNEIDSHRYRRIESKIEHIVPHYSIIGLLLRHGENTKSILSNRKDIMAHSVFSWITKEDRFLLEPLSKLSRNLDESIYNWLELHSDQDKERILNNIFHYLRKNGINNLSDVSKLKNIFILIKNNKDLDSETKEVISHFIKYNLEFYFDNRKDEIDI